MDELLLSWGKPVSEHCVHVGLVLDGEVKCPLPLVQIDVQQNGAKGQTGLQQNVFGVLQRRMSMYAKILMGK